MKFVCDLGITSAPHRGRRESGGGPGDPPPQPWYSPYQTGADGEVPSLVLDFENDIYGAGGTQSSFAALVNFSRASTATGVPTGGGSQTFANNEPVFDWSTGRRGLMLRAANGSRAADVAAVPLGPWWSATSGTVKVDARLVQSNTGFDRVIEIHDGGTANRISLLFNQSLGQIVFGVYRQGSAQAALLGAPTAYSIGAPLDGQGVFGLDDFRFQMNGASVLTDTSGTPPDTVSMLQLGARADNGNHGDMLLHHIVLFAQKLG